MRDQDDLRLTSASLPKDRPVLVSYSQFYFPLFVPPQPVDVGVTTYSSNREDCHKQITKVPLATPGFYDVLWSVIFSLPRKISSHLYVCTTVSWDLEWGVMYMFCYACLASTYCSQSELSHPTDFEPHASPGLSECERRNRSAEGHRGTFAPRAAGAEC